jgi:hypothetical protein
MAARTEITNLKKITIIFWISFLFVSIIQNMLSTESQISAFKIFFCCPLDSAALDSCSTCPTLDMPLIIQPGRGIMALHHRR